MRQKDISNILSTAPDRVRAHLARPEPNRNVDAPPWCRGLPCHHTATDDCLGAAAQYRTASAPAHFMHCVVDQGYRLLGPRAGRYQGARHSGATRTWILEATLQCWMPIHYTERRDHLRRRSARRLRTIVPQSNSHLVGNSRQRRGRKNWDRGREIKIYREAEISGNFFRNARIDRNDYGPRMAHRGRRALPECAAASTRWHRGSPKSEALSPAVCAAGPCQNRGREKTLNSTSQEDQSILEYIL
jgi:hypothetical protein